MDRVGSRASRLLAVAIAVGAMLVVAAPAGAVIVTQPDGTRVSMALQSGVDPASLPGSTASGVNPYDTGGNVVYHGGPVMHSVTNYALFWDPGSLFTTAIANSR